MLNFQRLFSQHVGPAFIRQLAFADFLGDRGWSVDTRRGRVQFGHDLTFPIQILGAEAHDRQTWLWAWANHASNLPAGLTTAAQRLQKLGIEHGIRELERPEHPLSEVGGHQFALLASGVIGRCAYYRGPYEGGALFFLVQELPTTVLQPAPTARIVDVLTQVVSQYELDHRLLVDSFLRDQGFRIEGGNGVLRGVRREEALEVKFDDVGRITQISGALLPGNDPPPPPPRPWWKFW